MIEVKFQLRKALTSNFSKNIWLILVALGFLTFLFILYFEFNRTLSAGIAIVLVVLGVLLYIVDQVYQSLKLSVTEQVRLEASLNSLNIGFLIFDEMLNIKTINGAAKRMIFPDELNASAAIIRSTEWLGKQSSMNFKGNDINFDWEVIEQKLSKVVDLSTNLKKSMLEKKTIEFKKLSYNNLFINIFITPVVKYHQSIQVIGVVVLIEDITESQLLEKSKDDFFSIASHELRTPLTTIRGNTSIILEYFADKLSDPDLKEMVADIHESSVRLIDLVNDFLDTSRLEQGRIKFEKQPFNIFEVASKVVEEMHTLADQKNIYLKNDVETNLPHVLADKAKIQQILTNLVGNSVKFTQTGGVNIWSQNKSDFIKIFVHDTGRGILENDQKLLFRKFQQASDNPLIRDSKRSTGLGLYISKLLVEGMGGEIKLEHSEPNKGSIFSFSLPVVTQDESTHDLTIGVSSLDRTSSVVGKPTASQPEFYRDKLV